jgi:hypothetical protein
MRQRPAHAIQLVPHARHQTAEDGCRLLIIGWVEVLDRFDDRGDGDRQTVESPKKTKKNQRVDDVARDFPPFVHALCHGILDRAGRRGRNRASFGMLSQESCERRQHPRWTPNVMAFPTLDEPLYPVDRPKDLEHLKEAGEHTDEEDENNRPIQVQVRLKNRNEVRIDQIDPGTNQRQEDEHQGDLPKRRREMRVCAAVLSCSLCHIPRPFSGLTRKS